MRRIQLANQDCWRCGSLLWAMLVLVCAGALAGCGSGVARDVPVKEASVTSDQRPARGMVFDAFTHDGVTYPYVLYVPRAYSPQTKWPLIVFLHGSGESGRDGQKQAIQGLGSNVLWNADRWPCLILMPQKPDHGKLWPNYEGMVMGVLAEVLERYSVDRDRVSLTGMSQGGHGTFWFGAKHPDVWSALAPVCGFVDSNRATDDTDALATGMKGLPIWAFHGDADDVVPVGQTQKVIDALRRAGAAPEPRFTVYPGVNHNAWDRAYAEPELPTFLLRSRKDATRR